jgi:thioredoxin-dependent peroxiredoxin
VESGEPAPDFELWGVKLDGDEVAHTPYRLSQHRGHPIVLAFYPMDSSAVCTKQLCEYEDEFGGFEALGADVWAISKQGLESHETFARNRRLSFPLLADTADVADRYGVTMLGGKAIRRAVFIIDGEGVVRWKHVAMLGFSYRSAAEIRAKLLELFPVPGGGAFDLPAPAGQAYDLPAPVVEPVETT